MGRGSFSPRGWAAAWVLAVALSACSSLDRPEAPPQAAVACLDEARSLESGGRSEAALAPLQKAIDLYPRYAEAHRALQDVRLLRFEHEGLIRDYDRWLRERPDDPV